MSLHHHPILNKHAGVGIDIDLTLINGPYSRDIQEWCREYHEEIDMHLITFRYGWDLEVVNFDIKEFVDPDWFKGIHGIPQDIGHAYNRHHFLFEKSFRNGNRSKFMRTLQYHKLEFCDVIRIENQFKEWKALKCHELGLTALIDDLGEMVLPGCEKYAIEWVDSLDYHGHYRNVV